MWGTSQLNQFMVPIIVAIIAAASPLLTFAFSIYRDIQEKSEQIRQKQYEQYHKLIGDLVSNAKGFVDSQIAIVFELKYFRKYRKLTIRIFEGLIKLWQNEPKASGLINEMQITIKALKKWPGIWRLCYLFY